MPCGADQRPGRRQPIHEAIVAVHHPGEVAQDQERLGGGHACGDPVVQRVRLQSERDAGRLRRVGERKIPAPAFQLHREQAQRLPPRQPDAEIRAAAQMEFRVRVRVEIGGVRLGRRRQVAPCREAAALQDLIRGEVDDVGVSRKHHRRRLRAIDALDGDDVRVQGGGVASEAGEVFGSLRPDPCREGRIADRAERQPSKIPGRDRKAAGLHALRKQEPER